MFNEMQRAAGGFGVSFLVTHICPNEKIRAACAGEPLKGHDYPSVILLPDRNYSVTSSFLAVPKLVKMAITFKPDIVIVSGYADITSWAMLAISGLLRFEFTGFFDSTEIDKSRTPWKEFVKRIFIGRVRRAFAYGTSSAEYLMKLGIGQERIVRRCQAADTVSLEKWLEPAALFKNRSNPGKSVTFGYVGRLAPEKNLFVLLSAFNALAHTSSEHQLIIVGDGPSRGELESFVGEKGIKGVRFVGSVPPEEVGSWMSQFDVFVLPSSSEPWGLVVNEAMFLAIPTVVSKQCGCCADLIQNGVTGFSFSANDVSELSGILETLSVNPKLRSDIGLAGKQKIAEFTPRTAALQILNGLNQ